MQHCSLASKLNPKVLAEQSHRLRQRNQSWIYKDDLNSSRSNSFIKFCSESILEDQLRLEGNLNLKSKGTDSRKETKGTQKLTQLTEKDSALRQRAACYVGTREDYSSSRAKSYDCSENSPQPI